MSERKHKKDRIIASFTKEVTRKDLQRLTLAWCIRVKKIVCEVHGQERFVSRNHAAAW